MLPEFADITFGLESLWIVNRAANSVIEVDTATIQRQRDITVGNAPSAVAVGLDSLWVANFEDDTVTRIAISGRGQTPTLTLIPVGDGPADVAVGEGGVWVYAYNGTDGDLTRIDPGNNSLVASDSMEGTGPLAVGVGNLWLVDNPKHLIWQIDPGSATAVRPQTVVRSITVGQNPVDVAVGLDSVWVASGDGTVSRIDPIAARVVETIRVGRNIGGIAVGGGLVWVTVD